MRGLWRRNGKFYANLTVIDDLGRGSSSWVPLSGVTLDEARADYARLLTERDDDRLRPTGMVPTLGDYIGSTTAEPSGETNSGAATEAGDDDDDATAKRRKLATYTECLRVSGKRTSTINKDLGYLRRWKRELGHLRLNKIRPHHLSHVLTKLAGSDYSARTVNLYLIGVRGVLKAALRDGYLKPPLPFEGLAWQRVNQKARQLVTPSEIDQLCEVAPKVSRNGHQFVDYLRFLQYSGARRSEALRVRWQDVDFSSGHVTFGAEGDAKNREARHVDFNPRLETHLKEMWSRRQPDSQWLFPSPQRGDRDISTKTLMESLRLTRNAAGCVCQRCQRLTVGAAIRHCAHCKSRRVERREKVLPDKLRKFGFHDLRHHFISYAVMSGVDFMTIARWVGHKDGGILIGKVYGHLADEHRKAQAARLNFGPVVVAPPIANVQTK
ncbi:MAG TPA: tyrosine-type recombinase/integrase [Candidatus Angelobacter sp.]|nr:tyrosine-type recombinase/integrase [Candidatus Angelobacter sp.]